MPPPLKPPLYGSQIRLCFVFAAKPPAPEFLPPYFNANVRCVCRCLTVASTFSRKFYQQANTSIDAKSGRI